MKLLERDRDLDVPAKALAVARGGQGRLALIGGEAGIGKTMPATPAMSSGSIG